MFKIFERYRDYAPLILRIAIGLVFLLHGLSKFGVLGDGNLQQTGAMFTGMNMPLPSVTAPLVATIEVIGGVALLLGFGTRFASIPLVVIMLVAIFAVKLPNGLNPVGRARSGDTGGVVGAAAPGVRAAGAGAQISETGYEVTGLLGSSSRQGRGCSTPPMKPDAPGSAI